MRYSTVALPDDTSDKRRRLITAGELCIHLFEEFRDLSALNSAIVVLEDAVRITPGGHPGKPACLSNLGDAFSSGVNKMDHFQISKSLSLLNRMLSVLPQETIPISTYF